MRVRVSVHVSCWMLYACLSAGARYAADALVGYLAVGCGGKHPCELKLLRT